MLRSISIERRLLVLGLTALILGITVWSRFDEVRAGYQGIRVRRAFRQRDWQSALALLHNYPAAAKSTAEWNYLCARANRRAGEHEQAAEALQTAADLNWNRA